MTLTDSDFKSLRELFEQILEEKEVVTKKDLEYLPNKDEFYEETGKILKRLDDLEVEKDVLAQHSKDHAYDIENLKKIHPNYKHSFT